MEEARARLRAKLAELVEEVGGPEAIPRFGEVPTELIRRAARNDAARARRNPLRPSPS